MGCLYKHSLNIKERQTMIEITSIIEKDIENSCINDGIAVVYSPHTTAGITINENADPDVVKDIIYGFDKIYPIGDRNYKHFEGNSHAHMEASTMGPSQTIIINDGRLLLGRWQGIYFCEFDGPRDRNFYVKIIKG